MGRQPVRALGRAAGAALTAILLVFGSGAARATDPEECRLVRMADPGWTDIASTNALFGQMLKALGYEQKILTLGVPVIYRSLGEGMLDVFLGNWMPAQTKFVDPLIKAGKLDVVKRNLSGVRFTLAVPTYVADAGVTRVEDLAAHGDEFKHKIFGIESGAPANQNIQKMLTSGDYGLKDWKLVESSEQGMLAQVERAVRQKSWIVFLGWEPHPMNTHFNMTYLAGGEAYFGPHYGSSDVFTVTRTGFTARCPNLGRLLGQLVFTVDMENQIMGDILNDGATADAAAAAWLRAHPEVLTRWLDGVTARDGGAGLAKTRAALGLAP